MYISGINEHNYKAIGYLMYLGFTQDDLGKWNYSGGNWHIFEGVDFYEIGLIRAGRLTVKFGQVYAEFYLNTREHLDSLEGCPDYCSSFVLKGSINDIDYLPVSDNYDLSDCHVFRILVPFIDHVNNLNLSYNEHLVSLDNFPKSCNVLNISGTYIQSLDGIPTIYDRLHIEHLEIDSLKGLENMQFNELYAHCCTIKNLEFCPTINHVLNMTNCDVKSLKGLKGQIKREIDLSCCPIEDLSYLDNIDTEKLNVSSCSIKSFDNFKGKAEILQANNMNSLTDLKIDFNQFKNIYFSSKNMSMYDLLNAGLLESRISRSVAQDLELQFIKVAIDIEKLDVLTLSKDMYFERLFNYLIGISTGEKKMLEIAWNDEYLDKVKNYFKSKEPISKFNL